MWEKVHNRQKTKEEEKEGGFWGGKGEKLAGTGGGDPWKGKTEEPCGVFTVFQQDEKQDGPKNCFIKGSWERGGE